MKNRLSGRKNITVTAFWAYGSLVLNLFLITCLAIFSFHQFNRSFSRLANFSLPRIMAGTRLSENINHLMLDTEMLSGSDSEAKNRLINSDIKKRLDKIHEILESEDISDPETDNSLYLLKPIFSELNELRSEINKTDAQIDNAADSLIDILNDIVKIRETGRDRDIHEWKTRAVHIITEAEGGSSLGTLFLLRQLESRIGGELNDLNVISDKLNNSQKDSASNMELLLQSAILGDEGVIPLVIRRSEMVSQCVSKQNMARKLISGFGITNSSSTNQVLSASADMSRRISRLLAKTLWIYSLLAGFAILAAIGVLLFFNKIVMNRLIMLSSAILDESPQKLTAVEKKRNDEISDIARSIAFYQNEMKNKEKELTELATLDPLTGIPNRRSFMELAENAMKESERYGSSFTLLMFDLDNFKKINDSYGHAAGDAVLKTVCHSVKEIMRQTDIFCRIGGEEFILLLIRTPLSEGIAVAERFRMAIEESATETEKQGLVKCTASIGVAECRNGTPDLKELMKQADDALYKAKKGGRNCIISSNAFL